MLGSFQASCVFFSSFSILMIAMDRYRFILQPRQKQISIQMAVWFSLLSLFISGLMSSPLFIMTELEVYTNLLSEGVTSFCYEVVQVFRHCLLQLDIFRTGPMSTTTSPTPSSASLSSTSYPASSLATSTTMSASQSQSLKTAARLQTTVP